MDINWFVNMLKNGETYTIQNPDGEPYQVTRPPTTNSIKAANFIVQLHSQLEQSQLVTQNLQNQLQQSQHIIENLQGQLQQLQQSQHIIENLQGQLQQSQQATQTLHAQLQKLVDGLVQPTPPTQPPDTPAAQ